MTPDHWQAVKRVLERTLELEPDDRLAFLAEACGDDTSVRTDVESLLPHGADDGFLDEPVVGVPPPIPTAAFGAHSPVSGPVDEVRPLDLAPYTEMTVTTKWTAYRLVVVAPLDQAIVVQGGRRLPQPVRATLHRQEAISVGQEMRLLVGSQLVTTTPIRSIDIRR